MYQQFGLDMFSSSFVAEVASIALQGKSPWIGEMSILGVVPDSTTVTGTSRPYTF